MRQRLVCFANAALALVLAHLPLTAQASMPDVELKLRAGTTAGAIHRDLRNGKVFGIGFGVAIPLSGASALTVDLGYDYSPGTGYDAMPSSNAPIWYNYQGTLIDNWQGHRLFIRPAQSFGSFDSRKRSIEGFSLRAGYRAPIPALPDFSWQAGLSLERYKAKSQLTGNIVPNYIATGTTVSNLGVNEYEGWAISQEHTSVSPGAYAGVVYQMQPDYKLELNARSVGYRFLEYTPLGYTGQPARLFVKKGRGFAFEFAFAIKL